MKYNYTVSTHTIWTSFDFGTVEADTIEQAQEKAITELKENFDACNAALQLCENTKGMSVEFDKSQVQCEPVPEGKDSWRDVK